jgi:hypothetical protein
MHTSDVFTLLFTLLVLVLVAGTIYSLVVQSSYSNYAVMVTVLAVLGLVVVTRSTVHEKDLDMIGLNLGPSDTRRWLRWGREKKAHHESYNPDSITAGKRKFKRH